jgi:hypothetical protein
VVSCIWGRGVEGGRCPGSFQRCLVFVLGAKFRDLELFETEGVGFGGDTLGDKGEVPGGQGGPCCVAGAMCLGACSEHEGGDVLTEPKDWAIEGQGVSPSADVDLADVPSARGGRKKVIAGGKVAILFLQLVRGLQGEEVEVDVVFPASVPEGTVEETVGNVWGIPA